VPKTANHELKTFMGSFIPSFNALFTWGLVEQVMATVQNTQEAAIQAYGSTIFGPLDLIADFHKGKEASTAWPCMTVTGEIIDFDKEKQQVVRAYKANIYVHLDVSLTSPPQLEDWSQQYARLLDQIFSTVTYRLSSTVIWETAQAITWPTGTIARQTAAFDQGSVKLMTISPPHIGLVPGDENATPVNRISVALEFEMEEK
jgi:hypothetical protein